MEMLPIYLDEQMKRCKEAGLDPSMIYLLEVGKGGRIPKKDWQKVNQQKLGNLIVLVPFLKEVEETKSKVEPQLYNYSIQHLKWEIPDQETWKIIDKAIKSPSWRERSAMIHYISRIYGQRFDDIILDSALAIELMQEGFMLRDDILDEQRTCVNRETIPSLYGKKKASLAVDMILSSARQIMRRSRFNGEANKLLEEMMYNDAIGQMVDLNSEEEKWWSDLDKAEKKYFEMLSLTPGTQFKNIPAIAYILSIENPEKEGIEKLKQFGLNLGIATQMRDDIIDIIGDEEIVYKKLGTDVTRRIARLPLIDYLRNHPETIRIVERGNELELSKFVGEIRNSGSINYCVSRLREYTNRALQYLSKTSFPEKSLLEGICDMITNFEGY